MAWWSHATGKQLGLAVSGVTSLTVPGDAKRVLIGVEGADVRWTHDASSPSATNGMRASSGSFIEFMDVGVDHSAVLVDLRFIEVSGSPVLQVLYFD